MVHKTNKVWSVLCMLLVGALFMGCASTESRYDNVVVNNNGQVTAPSASSSGSKEGDPRVLNGECKYFAGGGGIVLINAEGVVDDEDVKLNLYDPKTADARPMVERKEASDATKAALGLAGDPRLAFIRRSGDPMHGNFSVWRRSWYFGFIPALRQHRVWFRVAAMNGAPLVDNDPEDGVQKLGYCFIDSEGVASERQCHLGHAAGATSEAPAKRLFQVSVTQPVAANTAQQ